MCKYTNNRWNVATSCEMMKTTGEIIYPIQHILKNQHNHSENLITATSNGPWMSAKSLIHNGQSLGRCQFLLGGLCVKIPGKIEKAPCSKVLETMFVTEATRRSFDITFWPSGHSIKLGITEVKVNLWWVNIKMNTGWIWMDHTIYKVQRIALLVDLILRCCLDWHIEVLSETFYLLMPLQKTEEANGSLDGLGTTATGWNPHVFRKRKMILKYSNQVWSLVVKEHLQAGANG